MNTIERNTDKFVTELKRIVADSEELLRKTADVVGENAREARERLRDSIETARRTCHDLERKTGRAVRAAGTTVRHHPYESIGIAVAAGVLVGLLLHRR